MLAVFCFHSGVTASSGESNSRAGSSHRALGAIYSYSHHVSGNVTQESGPRKVHATTFTPEVGTIHKGPITSPVSSSNSNSSCGSSMSPTSTAPGDHKRGSNRTHQEAMRTTGRPCLTGAEPKSHVISPAQQLHTVKQRLGHHPKKRELDSKSSCRLSSQATSQSSVLSRGPLLAALKSTPEKEPKLKSNHDPAVSKKPEEGQDHHDTQSTEQLGKTGGAYTAPEESMVKDAGSNQAQLDSKRHLLRLTAANREDQLHARTSLPASALGKHVSSSRLLFGTSTSVDACSGNIVPKEEAIEEEQRTEKPANGGRSDSEKRHHKDHHAAYEWTSPLGAMAATAGYALDANATHRSLTIASALEAPVNPSTSHSEAVIKEEDKNESREHRTREQSISEEQIVSKEHESRPDSRPPYLMSPPLLTAANGAAVLSPSGHLVKVRRKNATESDVKPVLVHAQAEHSRFAPVQPVVNGAAGGRAVPEVKEGNSPEETPSTSGRCRKLLCFYLLRFYVQ